MSMKMIEMLAELKQSVETLRTEVHARFDSLEKRMQQHTSKWDQLNEDKVRKERNRERKRQYQEAKKRRNAGLLELPEKHILRYRDSRLEPKFREWAEMGMLFGKEDRPEHFLTYVVHQWNNCTYLKKPITFSGSSFRVWNSNTRFAYGPRDLLGFCEKNNCVGKLRNDAEHDDFTKRAWWDWNFSVLSRVYFQMEELGLKQLPERFKRCVQIIIGCYGNYQFSEDLVWNFYAGRNDLNKMLFRCGVDLQRMLRAIFVGLRVKGRESPVTLPKRP